MQNLHACQVLTSCAISAQLIRVMRLLSYTDTLNYFYLFQSTVMLGRYDGVARSNLAAQNNRSTNEIYHAAIAEDEKVNAIRYGEC